MANLYRKTGVFCLEGQWGNFADRRTLRPLLDIISSQTSGRVKTLHREAATEEEFDYYIRRWLQKQNAVYRVLWLGFHGEQGALHVGDNGAYSLDRIGELLEGRCQGRVIYFGSCSTMAVHGTKLNSFLKRTGANAVIGYTKDVDWLESTSFELLLIDALSLFARPATAHKYLLKNHAGFVGRLGLRFITN